MTIHVTAYIVCDWCKATAPSATSTVRTAEAAVRDRAWIAGWKRRKLPNGTMGDICPQCQQEQDIKKASKRAVQP